MEGGVLRRSSKSLSGVPVVRFSHSLAFIDHLRQSGAPTDRYLQKSKLPTLCENPDCLIPVERMYQFLAEAACNEEPLLGWFVGGSVGERQLSTTLLKRLRATPTLLVALQNLASLIKSESSEIDVGLFEREKDIVFFTRYPRMRGAPGYEIGQSYQISVFMSLVQAFLGKDWRPAEIGLESRRSQPMLPEGFHGSHFIPNAEFGYFTVARSCLHRAISNGYSGSTSPAGTPLLGELDELELMRKLLRSYLADGYISKTFAAELLDTPVRTLSRRFSEHGTNYQQFMDSLRFQEAKEGLQNPDMQVLDVANSVGFSDQGDFTRMFRRVSGVTPTDFRRTLCIEMQ